MVVSFHENVCALKIKVTEGQIVLYKAFLILHG